MFYTQYRPQKFSELVGLDKIAQAILSQISKGEVPHALFFFGPRGTGKTTTARLVAKALNCSKSGKDSEPCGKCASCKAIAAGRFLDLIEIDAASNRGIDDIRDLREKIKLSPTEAKYKIYIIDEVHMLTTEAFNALLKTLEEPPQHAVFILCTTDPHKVPATIKSRCQKHEFKRASTSDIVSKLKTIVEDQKVKVTEEQLKLIATAAQGGFRDAETLLEEVIKGGITAQEAVGLSAEAKVAEFVDFLVREDQAGAIKLINEVYEAGVDLSVWTRELLSYLRKMMLVEVGVGQELVDVTKEEYEVMEHQLKSRRGDSRIARTLERLFSQDLVETFMKAYEQLKYAAIPQLPLEVAVVKMLAEDRGQSTEDRLRKTGRSQSSLPISEAEIVNGKQKSVFSSPSSSPSSVVSPLTSPLDFKKIIEHWEDVLVKIKPYNHSLEAVLRSCFIIPDADQLIIGVPFKFHLDKLNDAKNYQIVKKVISEVVGQEVDYTCQIAKREVTAADKLKATSKKAKETFNGTVGV